MVRTMEGYDMAATWGRSMRATTSVCLGLAVLTPVASVVQATPFPPISYFHLPGNVAGASAQPVGTGPGASSDRSGRRRCTSGSALVAISCYSYSYNVIPNVPTRARIDPHGSQAFEGAYFVSIFDTDEQARQDNVAARESSATGGPEGPSRAYTFLPIARPVASNEWLRGGIVSNTTADCYAQGGVRYQNVTMSAAIFARDTITPAGFVTCQASYKWTTRVLAALYARALPYVSGISGTPVQPQTSTITPSTGAYTIVDLGALPGSPSSSAAAINATGDVVGSSGPGGGQVFLYTGGALRDLGTLGGLNAGAAAINDADQVVGIITPRQGPPHAYVYARGSVKNVGVGGAEVTSYATAINDAGQIVGVFSSANGPRHAFLYSKGQTRDLGTLPGYQNSSAQSINAAGQVVGQAFTFNRSTGVDQARAFLYNDGVLRGLPLPTGASAGATSINDVGQVVGGMTTKDGMSDHAFLYDVKRKVLRDLGVLPSYPSSTAASINDAGQIVGVVGPTRNEAQGTAGDLLRPFIYNKGVMRDLNTLYLCSF